MNVISSVVGVARRMPILGRDQKFRAELFVQIKFAKGSMHISGDMIFSWYVDQLFYNLLFFNTRIGKKIFLA